MPTPPNPLRRNEASRRSILDAALELCAEVGYGRLTVEAIAARAGVSKKTIYRWWPSKGAVMLDAVDERAKAVAAHPYTGDLATDLRNQLAAVVALLTPSDRSPVAGLIAEAMHDDELAHDLRERLIRPRIDSFDERLRQAQRDGQFPADADLDVALGLVYGPIYHRLVFHLGMPDAAQLDTLVTHALRAFVTKSGTS
ncbi:TetR/AcrR family transcriptional regulator [Asanoa siamensis]|uniref:TetR family transcriptional regulator n=1 Tax=Asanoa siamensis TaxID=926357 RepID=A0ABQ4CYR5_9ACTN|nr:TetR/AcrR family transcriptional regulator [Asanoa siamensis]GIF76425.1 TetR family transcriptional regulator [Asanoa siamensis]